MRYFRARDRSTHSPRSAQGTTFEIKAEGSGTEITAGCTATVHATGVVLQTGKKFWSTKDPGQQPFTYQAGVGGVIKGCDAARPSP